MYTSFVLLLLLPWYINNRIKFLREKGKNSHSNICKAFSLITIKCLHNIYLITVILLIAQVLKSTKKKKPDYPVYTFTLQLFKLLLFLF